MRERRGRPSGGILELSCEVVQGTCWANAEKKKKSKPLSKLTMIHFVDLDHGLEKKSIDRLPATANGSQQVSLIVCEFNSSAIFFILLHGNHQNRYGSAGIHKPFNAVS